MFFVLRRKNDKAFLKDIGRAYTTTQVLNEAKMFKLTLEPEHQDMPHERTTTGEVVCEVEGGLPRDLVGEWEIVLVEVRLV
jgi:hypothetical protein